MIIEKNNNTDVFVLCNQFKEIEYNSHFDAYVVCNFEKPKNDNLIILNLNKFTSPPLHVNKLTCNRHMVRLKPNF